MQNATIRKQPGTAFKRERLVIHHINLQTACYSIIDVSFNYWLCHSVTFSYIFIRIAFPLSYIDPKWLKKRFHCYPLELGVVFYGLNYHESNATFILMKES